MKLVVEKASTLNKKMMFALKVKCKRIDVLSVDYISWRVKLSAVVALKMYKSFGSLLERLIRCFVGVHRINYPVGLSGRIVGFPTIRYPAGYFSLSGRIAGY